MMKILMPKALYFSYEDKQFKKNCIFNLESIDQDTSEITDKKFYFLLSIFHSFNHFFGLHHLLNESFNYLDHPN